MSLGAYIRVSTRSQDYASQRHTIEGALPKGAEPEWYREKASAKTTDRPVLARLLQDIRMGKVTTVYLFKLDRLTRSGVADTYRVVEEIRASGCTLVAVADNLTIRPGADDLTSTVLVFALSLAAKLEHTAINDRISSARTRMEATGRRWGRPHRATLAQEATARRMSCEGSSHRAIAQAIGVPKSTVGRMLAPLPC